MSPVEAFIRELRDRYSCLRDMPEALISGDLPGATHSLNVPAGTVLFEEGSPCNGFPMILDGEVCLSKRSADGARSMELYRISAGELCVVSASSLLAGSALSAHGVASRDSRLAVLSPQLFDRWTMDPVFRRFVFGVFAERLNDLMSLIDAVAFQRLDQRLADHLLGHGHELRTTHHAIADELGTVREIITRLLNRFEAAGFIRLGREHIEVLDAAGLRGLARGKPR